MPPSGALRRLDLICFGPPTARLDGREPPPEVLWPKHLALLIYLALSPDRRRTRDHLLGLLWPEKPDTQARHALNETLRRLRASLGADRLISVADAVALGDHLLEVDALRFAELAEAQPEEAAALLKGDFLEGFSVEGATEFEEWTRRERDRFQARGAAILVTLGEQRLAACQFPAAAELAGRALALQPYSELAARLLIRAAALNGDAASALAAFHRFAARLGREIGERPSKDLAGLADRIRSRSERAAFPPEDREPPLIGREQAHQTVFELLARALAAGPCTIMITGDPGMGRTRLLDECAKRLALEGALVATAKPLHSDHDAPWSTLRALIRTGLHRAPGLPAAAPDALAVLAWLVPELAERTRPREPHDAADVAHALTSVLRAIADEQPVALALDDAHLADGPTIGALGAALPRLDGAPILVLLTAVHTAAHEPPQLPQLRGQLGRALRGAGVRLDPWSPDEVAQLVAAMAPWCSDSVEQDRLARRLMFETAGNPFFAVTLLHRLERAATLRHDLTTWPTPHDTYGGRLPFSMPSLLNTSVTARVGELDEPQRRLLCAASIAGQAVDIELVAAVADLPASEVEVRLPDLERSHFLRFDGERYVFVAPLLADIIRGECLTPGQRQTLRRRAALALQPRTDLESRTLRTELRSRTDPGLATFEDAAALAGAAIAAGSARTARRALVAAERAARGVESARTALDRLRGEILG